MVFNYMGGRNGAIGQIQPPPGQPQPTPAPGWRDIPLQQPPSKRKRQRRLITFLTIVLLILIIFAGLRISEVASSANDQLLVHIGGQQVATLDLRQSFPISPYLFGTNVFPLHATSSLDSTTSGFMPYTSLMSSGMQAAGIKLLRYPGGNWGEQHILSDSQLDDFSKMLTQTNAQGMLQAHLSGPVVDQTGTLQPAGMTDSLASRANFAARWVSYMNTSKNGLHPVLFWTVGNEPDRLIDPLTRKPYTVADYVNAFIQFSRAMHQADPNIKVFGPEISQFFGVGAGPFDAGGHAWMDGFLEGVGAYEQAHFGKDMSYHLLDGVSFHFYPFSTSQAPSSLILSSANQWNYLLPPLRNLIQRDLGRDAPIAVTEINTNVGQIVPSPGIASLWWADTLGSLMNQEVGYAAFFSTAGVSRPYPLFTPDGLHETAMMRVMQLFSRLQHNLVPLSVQDNPVSVYATQDDSHQTVSLLFINKSSDAQLVQVAPADQVAGYSPWSSQSITLAGNSIVVVTLHRSAGADAYSFREPGGNSAAAAPLVYTVCGHKTDPLASSIPC
jgi:hypothetical protein